MQQRQGFSKVRESGNKVDEDKRGENLHQTIKQPFQSRIIKLKVKCAREKDSQLGLKRRKNRFYYPE